MSARLPGSKLPVIAPRRSACAALIVAETIHSATLRPRLLVLRGVDDPTDPPEYEKEIHDLVPGSRYVKLSGAGHFPPTEIPDKVNALIEEFVATL